MTWWCLIAPMRPTIAISNKNTPHAMMPPNTDTVAMTAAIFPYAATAISMIATAYSQISIHTISVHWYMNITKQNNTTSRIQRPHRWLIRHSVGDFTFWLGLLLSLLLSETWSWTWTLNSRLRPELNLTQVLDFEMFANVECFGSAKV